MQRTSLPSLKDRSFGRLERVVTVLVEAHLTDPGTAPPDLVERLRRLERTVRAARGDPQTLQVLTSGRRLLGDADELTPPEALLSSGPHLSSEPILAPEPQGLPPRR